MTSIQKLNLPHLPVSDPDFHRDPFAFVAEARSHHPWLAGFESGYVVYGYQALRELGAMDDKLEMGLAGVVDFYQAGDSHWARFMLEMMQSKSGVDHHRLRMSVAEAFSPRRAQQARPLMQQVISDLLDQWSPLGAFDFAEFAAHFPVTVLCGILGVPPDSIATIRADIETYMTLFGLQPQLKEDFLRAYDNLWCFVDRIVTTRETGALEQPHGDGLLDALIVSKNSGRISDDDLRFMLLDLLIAGYDTSTNILTLTVHQLLSHPDYWQRCADELPFCRQVIEEMLRFSSIATFFRTVKEAFEYDGVHFPRGTLLAFSIPLSGRDPAVFSDPDRFDPLRNSEQRHLAFGRGEHICLGQFLARAQLEEGLHLIAQRLRQPQLAGELQWRPFLGAWGLQSLPIKFEC
ncbi:cytochrome P450 [Pseudomaricurvus sp. HS19]|uniref:cytochrome P450 n=1 Tax=Pseudomaricurvus sp. HS19 TaxID=2692626 RepID=UPI00136E9740|nr:cytochrome P450 [Pseudomaricurvus sp. HS19]MYM63933.1 cytochrome P450 [Pseudomaricurvus sp. HS19]